MLQRKHDHQWERAAIRIFCVICGIVMAVLLYEGIIGSWINIEFWNEFVYPKEDNIGFNLLGMLVGGGMLVGAAKIAVRFPVSKRMDRVAAVVGILCVAISIYWICATRTQPQGDQEDVVNYAVDYKNGDTSSLEEGGYVAVYQQQLGLITFMRVLFLFCGQGNYKAFQYFSACMVFVMVFAGYKCIRFMTDDSTLAEWMYLLFMLFCVPMYGYTPFVYGEISSTALIFLAGWMFWSALERFAWWKWIVLAGACGAMVQFRKNALICAIAFLIVLIVKMIQTPRRDVLWIGTGILAGIIVLQMVISIIYKPFLGDAKPIPAMLYVVMGTNDEIEGEPGWYNGYNMMTYKENGFDSRKATEKAKQDFGLFLEKCKSDPIRTLQFYRLKMNIQWNVPMYQCLVVNNAFYDEPDPLASDIYFNGKDRYLEHFMEIYQLLIYGGALCFLIFIGFGGSINITGEERQAQVEKLLFMICVFGGFLFSLIWEAKPRYVFPYFLLMIPCAAAGIAGLEGRLKELVKRKS